MFDRKRFYEALDARGVSVTKLAELLKVHQATLFRKIKGDTEFTRAEMQAVREALAIDQKELDSIFFAQELA